MRRLPAILALTGLVGWLPAPYATSTATPASEVAYVVTADAPLHVREPIVSTSVVERPRPKRRTVKRSPARLGSGDLLDALAHCESGMDPTKNIGNGYLGAFQFLPSTAHALGLGSDPTVHDYATQKTAVAKIPISAWPRQFPGCSRKLGIR